MKKTRHLVRCFLGLILSMCAAMFYSPTAAADNMTEPVTRIDHVTDAGKMIKQDTTLVIKPCAATYKPLNQHSTRQGLSATPVASAVGFVIKPMAESYQGGYDYKDDPHIN